MNRELESAISTRRTPPRIWLWAAIVCLPVVISIALPIALVHESHGTRGLFTTDNLIVKNTSVLTGRTSIQQENLSPADNIGLLTAQTIFSDWAPAGLQTHTPLVVTGSDNSGTVITGIDSTGIVVGDVRTICNLNGRGDDSTVSLTNQDARSLAANRFLTPDAGLYTIPTIADFYIGPDHCQDVMYAQPDVTDLTFHAWIVKGGQRRFSTVATQALQFYPQMTAQPITGTVNDYAPAMTAPYVCNPGAVPCGEAGFNGNWQSITVVHLGTVDSTGAILTGLAYVSASADTIGPVKLIYNDGPGPITLKNTDGASSPLNQFGFSLGANEDDIVIGAQRAPIMLYHQRDNGRWLALSHRDYDFDERDLIARKGAFVSGNTTQLGIGSPVQLAIDNQIPLQTNPSSYGVYLRDVNTYDTSGGPIVRTQLAIAADGSRGAGGANLQNIGLDIDAVNGQSNLALTIEHGGIYEGRGPTLDFNYINSVDTDFSNNGPVRVEGNLRVGGGAFTNEVHTQICSVAHATASSGTITTDAINCDGSVRGAGANTVTLTMTGNPFANFVHCNITVEGVGVTAAGVNVDATTNINAPVVYCWTPATGIALACPDFAFHCEGN